MLTVHDAVGTPIAIVELTELIVRTLVPHPIDPWAYDCGVAVQVHDCGALAVVKALTAPSGGFKRHHRETIMTALADPRLDISECAWEQRTIIGQRVAPIAKRYPLEPYRARGLFQQDIPAQPAPGLARQHFQFDTV